MSAKTILVVDDEEQVRMLLAELLASQGYVVCEASDGIEALEAARRLKGSLLMVVADVVMPNMDGLELGELLEDEMPEVPTLYVTGHDLPELDLLPSVLKKPFTPADLYAKVRSTLDLVQP